MKRCNVLPLVDAAVVVCEADPRKVFSLQLALRELEELRVPHFLFVNKIDAGGPRRARNDSRCCSRPSARRCWRGSCPIWKNGVAIGSSIWRSSAPMSIASTRSPRSSRIPSGDAAQEKEQRYSMLEASPTMDGRADGGIDLHIEPPRDQVFDDLAKSCEKGGRPLFFGSAARGAGVTRPAKGVGATRRPRDRDDAGAGWGVSDKGPPLARRIGTIHTSQWRPNCRWPACCAEPLVDGQSVLSRGRGQDFPASRACSRRAVEAQQALEGGHRWPSGV